MKRIFKCDYCDFIGTEEEVGEHELECVKNYNLRSCLTCVHNNGIKSVDGILTYDCGNGVNIPTGHIIEHCRRYERKENSSSKFYFRNPFGWMG